MNNLFVRDPVLAYEKGKKDGREQAIKEVLDMMRDFKHWNCVTSEKITIRSLELRIKKKFEVKEE